MALWILKASLIVLSEIINILRNSKKKNWDAPENFTIGLCTYTAPSSGHSLLTLNLSFIVILLKFKVVF